MKNISIVLTKYSDFTSNLLYLLSGFGFTHASIGLDSADGEMYSFNFKGFCVETLAKHRRRGVRHSRTYQLQISDASYARLENLIRYFVEHRAEFCYTRLGVVMSFLRIPFKRQNRYFCSHFVAEMLEQAGALRLKKAPSLYLPNHFCRELSHSAQLRGILYNPV